MGRTMRVGWGSGVVLLAMAMIACVPTPAGLASPSPTRSPQATATPVPTPFGPTPIPSFIRPTPTPSPDFVVYEVVRKDTLDSIARRFGTSGRSIAYWNRVTYPSLDPDSPKYEPDRIEVGWVLQLIPNHEVDPEDLPTLSPIPTPKPAPTPKPSATATPAPTSSP